MIETLCCVARYDEKRDTWVQVRPYNGRRFVSEPLTYRDASQFLARCREALPGEFRLFPLDALMDGRIESSPSWFERQMGA